MTNYGPENRALEQRRPEQMGSTLSPETRGAAYATGTGALAWVGGWAGWAVGEAIAPQVGRYFGNMAREGAENLVREEAPSIVPGFATESAAAAAGETASREAYDVASNRTVQGCEKIGSTLGGALAFGFAIYNERQALKAQHERNIQALLAEEKAYLKEHGEESFEHSDEDEFGFTNISPVSSPSP